MCLGLLIAVLAKYYELDEEDIDELISAVNKDE
jgi:hypothetical protein